MLKIDHVTKKFNNLTALKDLSLNLNSGEVLSLIGQNGAGKSTTFKLILNFIKANSGEISFNNHKLSVKDLDEIGYMPEERGLYLDMTIQQQVIYFAELHNYNKNKALKQLNYWIEKLEVKGYKNSKIKSLSKGNQQKVQLIASFIHNPKLLILDEPFSGLDPINSEILIGAVQKLKENGTAIIFSSHDMRNVERLSDKLLLLSNGKTILKGNLNDIKDKFGKTNLYIEGNFDKKVLDNLNGLIVIENDFPGFHLTFNNEVNAVKSLKYFKENYKLSGFRLFNPSMDDIFKLMISNTKKREEK